MAVKITTDPVQGAIVPIVDGKITIMVTIDEAAMVSASAVPDNGPPIPIPGTGSALPNPTIPEPYRFSVSPGTSYTIRIQAQNSNGLVILEFSITTGDRRAN